MLVYIELDAILAEKDDIAGRLLLHCEVVVQSLGHGWRALGRVCAFGEIGGKG